MFIGTRTFLAVIQNISPFGYIRKRHVVSLSSLLKANNDYDGSF
jgi:hypothetical protein